MTYLFWRYLVLGLFVAGIIWELKFELESDFKIPRKILGAIDIIAKFYILYWLLMTVNKF